MSPRQRTALLCGGENNGTSQSNARCCGGTDREPCLLGLDAKVVSIHFSSPTFPLTRVILLSPSSAQALCLSDEPRAVKEYRYPEKLPGELYDADTQCKWQFGEKAKLCTLDFKKVRLFFIIV